MPPHPAHGTLCIGPRSAEKLDINYLVLGIQIMEWAGLGPHDELQRWGVKWCQQLRDSEALKMRHQLAHCPRRSAFTVRLEVPVFEPFELHVPTSSW